MGITARSGRRIVLALALVLTVAVHAAPAHAGLPAERPVAIPGTTGSVDSVAVSGNTMYIGGGFNRVGTPAGNALFFNTATNSTVAMPTFTGGVIRAVEPDGIGGWFVGGSFTHVGGVARRGLVHVHASGAVSTLFNFQLSVGGTVRALTLDGGNLYIGGTFDSVNGVPRGDLAKLNALTGALDSNFNPDDPSGGTVLGLAVGGANLYVAGSFTTLGATARQRLAAVNKTTGVTAAWNPGADDQVNAIAYSSATSAVYVGGQFATVGGMAIESAAQIPVAGNVATVGWDPQLTITDEVYDIEIDGGSVWLGGDFDSVNGTARNNAAAVSDANSDGVTTAWNPNVDDVVEDMAIDNANNRMFLTGRFGTVGGSTRTGIAAVSQMGTGALDSWAPAAGVWGYAVGATTSSAFFGGAGAVTGGAARRNLAAINLQTGTVVTGFSADTNDTVLTIKVAFGRVYIGGHFTTVKGTPRLRAAAIDPATSQVTAWNPAAGAGVLDIETDADTVYIGGQFSSVAAVAHSGIAATDPTTGAVAAWNPDISAGSVTTLRLAGTRLYAGGTFTDVDGTSADGVAAFDTANNHALIPTFIPDLSSPATPITMGLAASSSAVWVGGSHTAVGDVLSANLQGIDPADGGPLDGWRTFGSDSMINDLQLIDGNLIAVGDFDNYDEVPRVGIVAIDPATGQPRDWRPHTAVNLAGDEAAAWGKGIVVGGDFTRGSTPAARNLLAYPGVATLLTAPKVSGTTKVGRTVTCSTGSWTGRPSLTVNWYSGTRRVAGGRKYRLRASDAGKSIRCRERAANAAGAALAYSAKRSVT